MKVIKGFKPVAGWAAAVLVLVTMQFFAGISARDARAARFESARRQACAEIAGIDGSSARQCLAAMKETIQGTGAGDIPRFDAIDLFSRISQAVPADLEVKLDDIRIDGRSLRLAGTTTGFQQSRALVDALAVVRCIVDLRADKTVKKGDRVMFSLTGRVDCSVKPKAADSAASAQAQSQGSTSTGPTSASSYQKPTVKKPLKPAVKGTSSKKGYGTGSKGASSTQTKRQAEQQERLRAAGDSAKVVEGPGEDAETDDTTEVKGYDEPIVDPSTGVAVPSSIPDPYPSIKPFPGGSLKLPNGIGNVMKLPEDSLVDVPPTDMDTEEDD